MQRWHLAVAALVIGVVAGAGALWLLAAPALPDPGGFVSGDAGAQHELETLSPDAPLQLIVEPDDGIAPVELAIRSASHSVDLTIYELEDDTIEKELADAALRGITVRVILEDLSSFGKHPNQQAFDYLKAHGVSIAWAPEYFPLSHEKALIVDDREAFVMTFNLVPHYYAGSRDFAVADTDPADVAAIESAFDADWKGTGARASSGNDLLWSPGAADALLLLISDASTSLDVYNEEMEDSRIIGALEAASRRGVKVRIVMSYATRWKAAFAELVSKGIALRTYASSAKTYIHAKALIEDGARAFVGSQNFSAQSLDTNRELGIFVARPEVVAKLLSLFQHDFSAARAYRVAP